MHVGEIIEGGVAGQAGAGDDWRFVEPALTREDVGTVALLERIAAAQDVIDQEGRAIRYCLSRLGGVRV